ncbi:hypothetical protein YC2023_001511 [Brassica napus]
MKKQSHVFFFFSTRSESSPTMVQRWHMYNHECKFSSLPCKENDKKINIPSNSLNSAVSYSSNVRWLTNTLPRC